VFHSGCVRRKKCEVAGEFVKGVIIQSREKRKWGVVEVGEGVTELANLLLWTREKNQTRQIRKEERRGVKSM